MARTPSTMVPLGTSAPDFALPDTISGRAMKLAGFKSKKALLVIFLCNHCPFVVHVREGLVALGRDYEKSDLAIVAISANDPETHPDDAPDKLGEESKRHGYRFPVLFDETQEVAMAFGAACTPDFFLYDAKRQLVYRGQLDGSRPGNDVPVTGADLRAAIDAVLAGRPLAAKQTASLGCNIKWRPGNAPRVSFG
jgi:peroxiredoxin